MFDSEKTKLDFSLDFSIVRLYLKQLITVNGADQAVVLRNYANAIELFQIAFDDFTVLESVPFALLLHYGSYKIF